MSRHKTTTQITPDIYAKMTQHFRSAKIEINTLEDAVFTLSTMGDRLPNWCLKDCRKIIQNHIYNGHDEFISATANKWHVKA